MKSDSTIIFVCEHGAAKSIVAAAHFNQLAKQRGLNLKAVARGTNPDHELSPSAVRGLANDGLVPTESTPQQLSLDDMRSAEHIVAFCELHEEYPHNGRGGSRSAPTLEQWDNIPPISENYEKARDKIVAQLEKMMNQSL